MENFSRAMFQMGMFCDLLFVQHFSNQVQINKYNPIGPKYVNMIAARYLLTVPLKGEHVVIEKA